ncbi:MAG: peptidoglycan bridge formation glycyltransferase FemA/FemB family protein [Patescibacteria group bacterium]|nr:peptidoglycan bridge formation glycyltransferase FemA/FemB family protein [Patescibacteria group bacterium]
MEIINIGESQKEIWNEFIAENCSESFLQSWEWGEFQSKIGRKVWRVGVIESDLLGEDKMEELRIKNQELKNKLSAVALIVKYDLPFGRSYFYCPRGPVIDESRIKNQESRILDFLFSEIKKIAKKEKSLFLRFDPPIEMNDCWFYGPERLWNQNAKLLQKSSTVPKGLWSQHNNLKKSPSEIQPRDTLFLDLTKSEEELLKEMKQKTRYNIRLAKRKELRIRNYESGITNQECFKEKFEEFWKLVEETSARDKFKSHNKNYYWKMLKNLGKMQKAPQPVRCGGAMEPTKLQAKLYFAEYGNKIIATNIVLFFGEIAVYLHGASSNEYRNVMAPYLLQWQQILDAKKAGCKKYDFWGISSKSQIQSANWRTKFNNWSGITRFKKGFSGYEKNYIGAYDLILDNIGYPIYKIVHKVKSL